MSGPTSTKTSTEQSHGHSESSAREPAPQTAEAQPYAGILALQRSAGNRAVGQLLRLAARDRLDHAENLAGAQTAAPDDRAPDGPELRAELLQRAATEAGQPLDQRLRAPIERALGVELGRVRVHTGPVAAAAAESLGARAYTVGADIYGGSELHQASDVERHRLLAHETVHTVQQGSRAVDLRGVLRVSQPGDAAEAEAGRITEMVAPGRAGGAPSPALGLRQALRTTPMAPSIQRDITGKKTLKNGEFKIDFKKKEGKVAGDTASEDGSIKFTPDKTAPESNSIRFVQIVRTFDTTTGKEYDWTGSPEAPRNKMMTKADKVKGIDPGFYVDQIAASLKKRTKKADPAVLPYYDVTGPPIAGNKIGKRKGKTIVPAVLVDTPGYSGALRYEFVTSAKASDTGTWYGTVLWGFEIFLDKKGIAKIKGEHNSFREDRGATTDAALKEFDEYYRNPGASTAPKK